jgi:formate-dependent nitrite reductase membrane component NrfD
MKSYEWMVKYTPQTEWIKGGGVMVWLSFFTGIIGAGAYLVSLYFGNFTGMIISWLILVIVKGGLHVIHTKKPARLWRIFLKFRTSWIARGMVFIGLVGIFGFIQILLSYLVPGTTIELIFKIITSLAVIAVFIYECFTIQVLSGIPFWHSSLLSVTLISWGLFNGLTLTTIITPQNELSDVIMVSRIVALISVILIILYLWNAFYTGAAARESFHKMTHSFMFWVGAVLVGLVVPLAIIFGVTDLGKPVASILFICNIIGTFAFTYTVFRVGVYNPLV